jgi:hypothetical protein
LAQPELNIKIFISFFNKSNIYNAQFLFTWKDSTVSWCDCPLFHRNILLLNLESFLRSQWFLKFPSKIFVQIKQMDGTKLCFYLLLSIPEDKNNISHILHEEWEVRYIV